jgi:threonine dehydratase
MKCQHNLVIYISNQKANHIIFENAMIPPQWFNQAKERIAPFVKVTPLTYDENYDLYLKWENHQVTGSFKARGAFNKVLTLENWEKAAGLLAASAGNHGQGVALVGQHVGAPVTIFAPENAPKVKIKGMQSLGAEVVLVQGGYEETEQKAIEIAATSSATWISPYNDGHVIAGQGTIALEIFDQLETTTMEKGDSFTWLVPTSGGGLLAGISGAIKGKTPGSHVIGVQTETSPFMHAIFHKGTQEGVIELPTIADGLAGPVENGSITIPIIREFVDDIVLVSESETADAVAFAWLQYGEKIEPSGAVSLAAALSGKISQRPVIAIISGGNIQDELFDQLIEVC